MGEEDWLDEWLKIATGPLAKDIKYFVTSKPPKPVTFGTKDHRWKEVKGEWKLVAIKHRKKTKKVNMAMEKFIRMECKTGGSNKFYEISVSVTPGIVTATWEVVASYGKIGRSPATIVKYSGTNLSSAYGVFGSLRTEKLNKGYVIKTDTEKPSEMPTKKVEVSVKAPETTKAKKVKAETSEDRFDNLDLD